MKLFPLLLVGVLLFAAVPHVPAIPQTVGGIFVNAGGNPRSLPVEDWFKEPGNWKVDTLPQASWSELPTERVLQAPGQVFGFPAESMRVIPSQAGEIQAVVVHFSAEGAKLTASELLKRVARNVGASTGASAVKGKEGQLSFTGKEYTVVLEASQSGSVIATLKR